MPTDLITTSYLGSFAGLVAVTYLLVQFFKDPIKQRLNDWWVRLLSVGIAVVIQLFVLYVSGNWTVEAIGLAVLNAFLIAITAAGMHDLSQTTSSPATIMSNLISVPSVIYKPQVLDVSPPINTPQPVTETTNDPEPIAPAI